MVGDAHDDCYSPYGYGYRSYYSMCGSACTRLATATTTTATALLPAYYPYGGWVDVGAIPDDR